MREYRPCRLCKDSPGYIKVKTSSGIDGVKRCSCWTKWKADRLTEIKLEKAGVPISIIPFDLLSYDLSKDYIGTTSKKCLEDKLYLYVNKFDEKFSDKLLYFQGDSGTQKTTVSCWLATQLIRKEKSVKYILMNDLLKLLQKADFDDSLSEEIRILYSVDFLIIDRAFDKNQVNLYKSGYQLSFLDTFLRKRVEQFGKALLIVSNTLLREIPDHGYTRDSMDFIERKTKQANSIFTFKDRYTKKDDFEIEDLWS